jgi:hypothetical protein
MRITRRPYGTILALAACAMLLLGVWLLRDASTPSVPPATPRAETPTPQRAAPQRSAAEDRYDLEKDEARGGHTLARHVAKSDAELRERLARERQIGAASTYLTREMAERTIARTLRAQAGRVRDWSARTGRRPNLALDYRGPAGEVIGRSIRRGREPVPCTDAIVVLRWDDGSYYVLTSYPEPSR